MTVTVTTKCQEDGASSPEVAKTRQWLLITSSRGTAAVVCPHSGSADQSETATSVTVAAGLPIGPRYGGTSAVAPAKAIRESTLVGSFSDQLCQ